VLIIRYIVIYIKLLYILADSRVFADEVFWDPDATRSSAHASRPHRYQPCHHVSTASVWF